MPNLVGQNIQPIKDPAISVPYDGPGMYRVLFVDSMGQTVDLGEVEVPEKSGLKKAPPKEEASSTPGQTKQDFDVLVIPDASACYQGCLQEAPLPRAWNRTRRTGTRWWQTRWWNLSEGSAWLPVIRLH